MDPHDENRIPGSDAGDQVGLGRVIEDRRSVGSPDTGDPGEPSQRLRTDATRADADDPLVEEASEDSFPASDPPTFMSDTPTPRDPERIELPAPREVP
jgi:hypothetical protein